jgi:hypothetical protein
MGATDPTAGGAPPPDDAGSPEDNVILTIARDPEGGGYLVYQGDEPEDGGEDMSADDADAMGPAGGAPSNQPQTAGSVGEALKIAMNILQQDEQSGGGGAEAAFASGFGGPQGATPAGNGGSPAAQKFA